VSIKPEELYITRLSSSAEFDAVSTCYETLYLVYTSLLRFLCRIIWKFHVIKREIEPISPSPTQPRSVSLSIQFETDLSYFSHFRGFYRQRWAFICVQVVDPETRSPVNITTYLGHHVS